MAPPRNTRRRNALADAAIEVLGTSGIHKLSHRAVDEHADLPTGTAANYFPRRDDLLAAAAERVAELHMTEMAAADRAAPPRDAAGPELLAELIGVSLYDAATRHRIRYLAAYELALESTRQPALAVAMARLGGGAMETTIAEHRALGLTTAPAQVQELIALYNGTLLTLVVAPAGSVTPEATLALARSLVAGVLRT
ncbi:MAG TPA: TetR/AcrR family transcriptional regulator [Trebonia sp.]|nr:TetR/AcrR family transcriptional regulator [Trebonia sp.]